MATEIYLRGLLDPVVVEEAFHEIVAALNKGASMGQAYTVVSDLSGNAVAFHHDNVQILRESDPDTDLMTHA